MKPPKPEAYTQKFIINFSCKIHVTEAPLFHPAVCTWNLWSPSWP